MRRKAGGRRRSRRLSPFPEGAQGSLVEAQRRLEIGSGNAVFNMIDHVRQLQPLGDRAALRPAQKTHQAAAKVGGLLGRAQPQDQRRKAQKQLGPAGAAQAAAAGRPDRSGWSERDRLSYEGRDDYSPAMVIPSMRKVGEATAPRNSRSSAMAVMLLSISFRLPAMVTSSTAKVSSPFSIHSPAAPRE